VQVRLRKHAEKKLVGKSFVPHKDRREEYVRPDINSSDANFDSRKSNGARVRSHEFALDGRFIDITDAGKKIFKHGVQLQKENGVWNIIVHYLRKIESIESAHKRNAPEVRGFVVAVDPGVKVPASLVSSQGPRTKDQAVREEPVGYAASIGNNTTELLNSRTIIHAEAKRRAYWLPNAPDGIDVVGSRNFARKSKQIAAKKKRRSAQKARKKATRKAREEAANVKESSSGVTAPTEVSRSVNDVDMPKEEEMHVYDLTIGLSGDDLEELKKIKSPEEKKKRQMEIVKERNAAEKKLKADLLQEIKDKKHKSRKTIRKK
jgi:hypothetical protein